MLHRSSSELQNGLNHVRQSPQESGTLEMIVRRPVRDEREELTTAQLDTVQGLIGDRWFKPDGSAKIDSQLTLINARFLSLIAGLRERWALAGDQLAVDLDLSEANLPPGTRLAIGGAVLEVSAAPHLGCGKFTDRFGEAVTALVNSPTGVELKLRGIKARILRSGTITLGDTIRREP